MAAQRATNDVETADRIFFSPLQDRTSTFVTELSRLNTDTGPAVATDH